MLELGPDIWRVAGADLRMPGGVRMPLASTVMRLPDRTLAIYSPIAFDDAQVATIDAAGEVAHVIVPSLLHHRFARHAVERWPRALVHAVPGIARKQPDLRVDHVLPSRGERDADPTHDASPLRDGLDIERISGAPRLEETVVFHRASGTLVCADLVFHITAPANLRSRAVFAMMGVGGGRLAQSRAWRFAVANRAAARASLDRILGWPIARVATSHGEPCAITATELAVRLVRAYRGRPPLDTIRAGDAFPVAIGKVLQGVRVRLPSMSIRVEASNKIAPSDGRNCARFLTMY